VKELVKFESELKESDLSFSTQLASVMGKHIEECLLSRAAWILVSFLENDRIKPLIIKKLMEKKSFI